MAIKIQTATKKDVPALLNHFKHYKIKSLIKDRVNTYLTSYAHTIVAKDGDKLVGVMQWYIKEHPKAGLAEFEELFVNASYRGKGIGSRMMQKGINDVKNYFKNRKIKPRKIYAFIDQDNITSIKLNKKFGFKKLATVGKLFSDKAKDVIYCLDLQKNRVEA